MKLSFKHIIGSVLIGVVMGVSISIIMIFKTFTNVESSLLYDFISLVISIILVIVIHELGHLVMGLLTGYRFLSFRIFNIQIQLDNSNKLKVFRHNLPGTLGQCLMKPPYSSDADVFWYNFGGVLFNLITVVITLIGAFIVNNRIIFNFFIILSFTSVIIAFMNWMPSVEISNDGYNYAAIKNNAKSRLAFFEMLKINALVSNNIRLSEIDLEDLKNIDLDYSDNIQINAMSFVLLQLQMNFNYAQYDEIIEYIYENISKSSMFYPLIKTDIYFSKLLQADSNANHYRTEEVSKILSKMRNYEGIMLINLYEQYVNEGNYDKDLYDKFKSKCYKSATLGMSLDLLDYANKILHISA